MFVHCLMDGRDTPPRSGAEYLARLEKRIAEIGCGRIATVIGRYYAMDRDNRWERVEKAYGAMVYGEGAEFATAAQAIERSYLAGEGDEFVLPSVIVADGEPVGQVRDGDGFIFFNFRSDRAREITRTLTDPGFTGFERRIPAETGLICLHDHL